MHSINKLVIVAAMAVVPAVSSAKFNAPTDSVSAAMATVVGDYVVESLESQYPGDDVARQMFIDGVSKAFAIDPVDAVYYDGLEQGMRMRDNLEQMRAAGYPVSDDEFVKYFKILLAGGSTGFNPASADMYLDEIQHRAVQADKAAQRRFIDQQSRREGVITLPSGVLFEVITEGEGNQPTADDTVEVLYTGKLIDGTVFDSTDTQPRKLPVNRLIAGFTEGLQQMKTGGTYRLIIPAELGYGAKGVGNDIPGWATLDFTVTLVDIVPTNVK